MRNPLYLNQLRRDLDRWIADGLVEPENRDRILATAGGGFSAGTLPAVLSILGVVLLGFAAMSFVAANWDQFPKLAKLTLLFFAMAGAYTLAAILFMRARPAQAQAAVLLGVAMFGVNIMLVAQIYHINAHYPDGLLIWGLGALAAAVLVPSRPALAAALAIGAYWTWSEFDDGFRGVHWPFVPFWAVAAILAHRLPWRMGVHLCFLVAAFWLGANTISTAELLDWEAGEGLAAATLLAYVAWLWGLTLQASGYLYGRALGHYGALLAGIIFFFLQMAFEDPGNFGTPWIAIMGGLLVAGLAGIAGAVRRGMPLVHALFAGLFLALIAGAPVFQAQLGDASPWVYGGVYLSFVIWAIFLGTEIEDRFLVNWAFVGFGAQAIYIYVSAFGTFLDDVAFFLIGGVLLIALSLVLERLRRRVIATEIAGRGGTS